MISTLSNKAELTEFGDENAKILDDCAELFRIALTINSRPNGLLILAAYIDSMRSDPRIYNHMPGMVRFFHALAEAVDRKYKEGLK